MRQNRKEKGFAHIGLAILMLVVVAALVSGAWWVWDKSKKDTPTTNPKQNTNQQQTTDPSEGGKYLVIKEWGVRALLPEDLRGGVKYGIVTSAKTRDTRTTGYFEIEKVAALPGSNCKLTETETPGSTGKSGGIGVYVTRSSSELPSGETPFYKAAKQIGSYWYYIAAMRDGCVEVSGNNTSDDQSRTELMVQSADSLVTALTNLEQSPIK